MKEYYRKQLDTLSIVDGHLTIKITDEYGNSTKNLNVNADSIEALINFFKQMQANGAIEK